MKTSRRRQTEMAEWEYVTALEKFVENMQIVLRNSLYKTLHGVEMVNNEVQIFDNIFSKIENVPERYESLPDVMVALFYVA
nr:hypothetical protein [Tanacetum cinerariifolium]